MSDFMNVAMDMRSGGETLIWDRLGSCLHVSACRVPGDLSNKVLLVFVLQKLTLIDGKAVESPQSYSLLIGLYAEVLPKQLDTKLVARGRNELRLGYRNSTGHRYRKLKHTSGKSHPQLFSLFFFFLGKLPRSIFIFILRVFLNTTYH